MNRIALVDDEVGVLNALQRVLRQHDRQALKVEAFSSPQAALVRAHEVPFDVVISDFRMPHMTGIEFLTRLRDVQPHAVRIILSASSDVEIIMKAVNQVEVFRYLSKPWAEHELLGHVRSALNLADHRRHERELANDMRARRGLVSATDLEKQKLEALEPGITHVEWGPHGEVLMPDLLGPEFAETGSDRLLG